MASQTQGQMVGDWLKYEAPNLYSREAITVLAGSGSARELTSGMVISKVTKATAAGVAFSGNAANTGTCGSVTVSAGAKVGVYKVVIVEPASNAGAFIVEDPDGILVGTGTVAVAFSGGGLAFTISDGSQDFVAGEGFNITVAAGSGKWVQYNEDGTDGSETPAGLLLLDVTAPDGTDADGVAIVREAIVSDNGITWTATANSGEKAAAVAVLKTLGILVRSGA